MKLVNEMELGKNKLTRSVTVGKAIKKKQKSNSAAISSDNIQKTGNALNWLGHSAVRD